MIRIIRIICFPVYFFKEIVIASLYIAWDIITPTSYLRPGIVEVPVNLKKEVSVMVLVNLISMTPGSLSLDLTSDMKKIYVHVLYLHDKKEFLRKTKEELEKRIQLIFEP